MTPTLDESYVWCRALAKQSAKNFYFSFLTLPRDRSDAMCALYAFMRVTDDLSDDESPGVDRAANLVRWRASLLAALDTGAFDHPILPALIEVLNRYRVPREYLLDVITGVEMDLRPVTFDTFSELERYCYHVAGAVGLACIHLWGFHDPRAISAAIDCGTAFQLTNILRDLQEDAGRDRLYLPQEDIARFGLTKEDLGADRRDVRFERLMQFEVARAREYYARAKALFAYLDPPGRPIFETMLRIYGGVLDEIERRHYDVFTRRVELSRSHKLFIAGQAIVRHRLRRIFFAE